VNDVKRWTISLPNPDGYQIHPWEPGLFNKPTEVVPASDYDALAARLADYKNAAPLCGEHQPNGGARATCLVCALIADSAALSRIDYLCGEPNEMELSGYDVHCNEDAVVKNVERLSKRLAGAVALLRGWDNADAIVIDRDYPPEAVAIAEQLWSDLHAFLVPADSAADGPGEEDGPWAKGWEERSK
jgi:hypothetical protein